MDMKQLLEKMAQFAGQAVGQKPGEQWKDDDPNPPGKKLVGDSIIKDLSTGPTPKTKEQELAEQWAAFNEDELGVEPKRPGRKSDRPGREYAKNGAPSKRYNAIKDKDLTEYRVQVDNFTADDIKELEGIRDLATVKARAFQLVSTPSKRPMKPEKVAWFKQAIESKTNTLAVIKLMWDLLLSGEGQQVIGSRHSMSSNSYRSRFNESEMSELDIELQDYRSMSDEEFKAAYNITKAEWMNKNKSIVIQNPALRKGLGITEGQQNSFYDGDRVELVPPYVAVPGEVYTVSQCDNERQRCWIGDADGFGWYATFDQLTPADEDDLDEGMEEFAKSQASKRAADKVYTITTTRYSNYGGRSSSRSKSGTLSELLDYFNYTLESGKSYERERGRYKINMSPKNIQALVDNLNKAVSNTAANSQSDRSFAAADEQVAEGKWFKTQYGWAGGRNEKTGGMYKHPDQVKADREAKKAEKAQQSKDAMTDMFGGSSGADLTRNLKIREDGSDVISQWGISQQEWAEFEGIAEELLSAVQSEEAWEKFWQVSEIDRLDKPLQGAIDTGLASGKLDRFTTNILNALRYGSEHFGTEPRAALDLTTMVLIKGLRKLQEVAEGWESGPDEYERPERDPDADYDAMRQEKADREEEERRAKRPQTKVYTLSGRGPNQEPNYEFPGEYASQEEAVAARTKLAANPKTPNPRDIGIRVHTKFLDLKEGIESANPTESAVLAAVQELIQQGHTEVAPEVITNMVVAATSQPFLLKDLVDANNNSLAIQHYIDSINPTKVKFSSDILTVKNEDPMKEKQVAQNGVAKMAAKAAGRSRLGESSYEEEAYYAALKNKNSLKDEEDYAAKRKALQQIQMDPNTANDPQLKAELARRLGSLTQQYSDLQSKLREFKESRGHKAVATKLDNMDRMKNVQIPTPAERREQIRIAKEKEQAMKGKSKVDEYGANNPPQGTTPQVNNPKQAQAVAQATQTLKTATGSSAPTTNIAKALDSASQGKPVGQQDMKAIEPLMKDVATIAQDPKLAGQFKTVLNQVQQAQLKQQ